VTFDELIAQSVTAHIQFNKSAPRSLFTIELVVQPGHTLEMRTKPSTAWLADLKKNPPTKAELQRALTRRRPDFYAMEILGGFSARRTTADVQPFISATRESWVGISIAIEGHHRISSACSQYLTDKRLVSTRRRRARRAER